MEGTNELWCRLDVPEEQGSASANAWFMLPLLLTSVPEDGTAPITTRSFYTGTCAWGRLSPSPDYRYLFSSPVWKETWTLY